MQIAVYTHVVNSLDSKIRYIETEIFVSAT